MEQAARAWLVVRPAESPEDRAACRELVRRTYEQLYGVRLTDDQTDPDGGVERFPDRFVMGTVEGQVVACSGLYVGNTYVEQYGHVSHDEIRKVLRQAGVELGSRPLVEYTKVVVDQLWARRGIGRRFIGATHSKALLSVDGVVPIVLVCAKLSVFRLWEAVGIRTRFLKPFPLYRNHARYRKEDDPMESRLVIPELDVQSKWYDRPLQSELEIQPGGIHAY